MSNLTSPKDGDFTAYVEKMSKQSVTPQQMAEPATEPKRRQNIQDVFDGEEPTAEFLEEWEVLNSLPPLSDEELEQQALADPGADGDPNTPE